MSGSISKYLSVLHEIIGPTDDKTLLDLCCGEMTATRQMTFRDRLCVDKVDWVNRPAEFRFLKQDALYVLDFTDNYSFDVSLCSDGIEHMTKDEGLKLLMEMPRVSELAIIFTPLGDMNIIPGATDPDSHKSGWLPDEPAFDGWKTLVFEDWHPTLNHGAFFAWKFS